MWSALRVNAAAGLENDDGDDGDSGSERGQSAASSLSSTRSNQGVTSPGRNTTTAFLSRESVRFVHG